MQELLWIDAAIKGLVGLGLVLLPRTALRLFGLHVDLQRFWPRMTGFLLIGIAAATLVSLLSPSTRGGLGPGGLVAINLAAASGLIAPLVWGTAAPVRRGRLLLVIATLTLLTLAFLEIAHL